MLLNFEKTWLEENNSFNTLNEIWQQPSVWRKVTELVKNKEAEIKKFISKNINKKTKIILTGAGTSEFVGNSIFNYFIKQGYNIASIATTDITTNPLEYFNPDDDIVLVSFARSGNSPESVIAYELVNSLGKNVKNIVIICNPEGALRYKIKNSKTDLLFLLPEEANDKAFAMTSSFTGMIVACYLILDINNLIQNAIQVEKIADSVDKNITTLYPQIKKIAEMNHKRIIFLGSGSLKGYSQESHLKILELTAGKVATFYNSPVGFRHGPKSILNDESIVIMLMSNNDYSRQYDIDLLEELNTQQQIDRLVVLDYKNDANINTKCDDYINFEFDEEPLLGLNYIIFAQLYAFYKSLQLGLTPDNPWPSGLVNRVVQGVKTYKYNK
ncbi:SIS domain-containing protein [Mesoplasma seiffertii]|uniref:SIS domain-containing protein n=1 Tax=Mesoplasma seiffertii TaxID=28224 RepID=UPI00068649EF|nr:SIS domain-containing protein [Mesoplasma seiffertii]